MAGELIEVVPNAAHDGDQVIKAGFDVGGHQIAGFDVGEGAPFQVGRYSLIEARG